MFRTHGVHFIYILPLVPFLLHQEQYGYCSLLSRFIRLIQQVFESFCNQLRILSMYDFLIFKREACSAFGSWQPSLATRLNIMKVSRNVMKLKVNIVLITSYRSQASLKISHCKKKKKKKFLMPQNNRNFVSVIHSNIVRYRNV